MNRPARLAVPALALLELFAWPPQTVADTQVSAECGVAAAGSIEVGGSVWIDCTPSKLVDLMEEQQAFRKSQLARIQDVAKDLGVSDCAAEELLAKVARESLPEGQTATRLAELAAELRGHQEGQDTLAPRGLVSDGSIEVAGHLVVGLPPHELDDLMRQVRDVDKGYLARIENLGRALKFSRCATAKFLQILDEKNVPPEQLSAKLTEIASQHRKTVADLKKLTTQDPQIAELRKLATKAIDDGNYESAKESLAVAQGILDKKTGETAPVSRDKATISAIQARAELTELHYATAAALFEEAAHNSLDAGKPGDHAHNLELAAGAFQDAGLYADAFDRYQEALKSLKKNPGDSPAEAVVTTLNNMGGLHFSESDYRNARKRFEEALIQATQLRGKIDVDLQASLEAVTHSGLADVDVASSDHDSAEAHYVQALSLLESLHGAQDLALLPTITNWGWLETNRGEYRNAESLFLRARAISRSGGKPPSLNAAATENNLATLYYTTGRYDEADERWKYVQEIYGQKLGKTHPATLVVTQNRARAQRNKGNLDEAEKIYDQALSTWETLAMDERQIQGSHLIIASLHAGLGDLHYDQERFTDAKEQYEEAIFMAELQLRDKNMVANSLAIAGYEHDLAVVLEELGEYEDAAEHLEKAVKTMTAKLPEHHPDLGTASNSLARVLVQLGKLEEAIPHNVTAITIAERTQRPLKVAARNRQLAAIYRELGRHEEARHHLEVAQEIYVSLGSEQAEELAQTREEINRELSELSGE